MLMDNYNLIQFMYIYIYIYIGIYKWQKRKGKGKVVPLQASSGLEVG
jgi:hypothetical protein